MSDSAPIVYLLHGDDEFAVKKFITNLESRIGDKSTAAMNITYLDERTFNPGDILSVASAMPFLAGRRLVVIKNPTSQIKSTTVRKTFLEQLEKVPQTTALVLAENRRLIDKKKKKNWLLKWAEKAGETTYIKEFSLPKGSAMINWICEQAKKEGGSFDRQAAELLAELIDGNPRLADQEIKKLLAYTNYQRPVEIDDVDLLTADVGQGDIFKFVDMIGSCNGRGAMEMLERLLERQDAIYLFGMVVRQFRLLLLTRETLDAGYKQADVAKMIKVHPFVAGKLVTQVRHFSLASLESIYRRLLDVDESIKTGEVPADLALETLITALTNSN
jgi:DNA polymerase-3 subunit delta